jgi:multidrug efflux pump
MTTAATVVGHFPLILATGPGAGARNSIGIMLVSGMIIGSAFTLFVVPSIYVLVARTRVPHLSMELTEDDVAVEPFAVASLPSYQASVQEIQ